MSGVAAACRRNGVPCVAIVGGMSVDARELLSCGIAALVPTVIDAGSIEDVLGHAEENYRFAAERVFSLVAIGMRLHLGDIESILKNAR
jgi:glycerate kinase